MERETVSRYRFENDRYWIEYVYAGTPGEALLAIEPHIRALEADEPTAGEYWLVGWEVVSPHEGPPEMVRIMSGPLDASSLRRAKYTAPCPPGAKGVVTCGTRA